MNLTIKPQPLPLLWKCICGWLGLAENMIENACPDCGEEVQVHIILQRKLNPIFIVES